MQTRAPALICQAELRPFRLEQVSKGTFEKRTLEMGVPRHATIDAADYDLDGDVDVAVGMFTFGHDRTPWVEVWENLRIDKVRNATAPGGAGPERRR